MSLISAFIDEFQCEKGRDYDEFRKQNKKIFMTILQLQWFLFTTGMRRYVLNETKSFLFNVIRVFDVCQHEL